MQKIVEKLVHFRLEFLLDDDSKNFDPGEWWATIMKTEFEFELKDMNKLSKVIGDFLKNMPKGTLGSSELISNDYADYGLQDYKTHTRIYQVRCYLNGCRHSEKTSKKPFLLQTTASRMLKRVPPLSR